MPFGRKAASARDPVSSCKLGGAAGCREGSEGPGEFLGPSPELGQAAEAELAQRLRRKPHADGRGRGSASATALGHAGPVRAAAREASFADAAEGAACVHAALALAQQPALVQLPALVDVWGWGRQVHLHRDARVRSPLSLHTSLWPGRAPTPPLAHPHSARERHRAGSLQDTRTRRHRAGARSGHSRSGTRPNPPLSCPPLRRPGECRH